MTVGGIEQAQLGVQHFLLGLPFVAPLFEVLQPRFDIEVFINL